MDEKGRDTAGSGRSTISGKTVSARTSSEAGPAAGLNDVNQDDDFKALEVSSAPEKAQILPHKMWFIVGAALLAWLIITIAAMLFFF